MKSSSSESRLTTIRKLNDTFRTTFLGGSLLVTSGIQAKGQRFVQAALQTVRSFDDFNGDNDPHGEHDFGALSVEDEKLFFKMDYYAPDMEHGSDDPANPEVTRRVLTVMLAEEY